MLVLVPAAFGLEDVGLICAFSKRDLSCNAYCNVLESIPRLASMPLFECLPHPPRTASFLYLFLPGLLLYFLKINLALLYYLGWDECLCTHTHTQTFIFIYNNKQLGNKQFFTPSGPVFTGVGWCGAPNKIRGAPYLNPH